jgi:4-amino-4-deoxy-L-arabinose transferase-like glycosyltransferase
MSFFAHLPPWVKRLDHWLDQHIGVVAGIALVVILRLPSLTEPYWYGDEAMYLAIGNSLRAGAVLYRDVFDHKPPVLYFIALWAETQLGFRLWLMASQLVAVVALYDVTRRWWRSSIASLLTVGFYALWTSLPYFEGIIANAELFVLTFVILGVWCLARGKTWSWQMASGFCLGLAFLTKAPALFDVIAVWWGWQLWLGTAQKQTLTEWVKKTWLQSWWYGVGVAVPIAISFVWYAARGAFVEYVKYGWLYNWLYVGRWGLEFLPAWARIFFSTPVKAVLLLVFLLGCWWLRSWWKPVGRWLVGWIALALFASTLSNRPYPHYWLQLILPFSLTLGYWWWSRQKKSSSTLITQVVFASICVLTFGVSVWLRVEPYPVRSAYQRWWSYARGQVPWDVYAAEFQSFVAGNRQVLNTLPFGPGDRVYIWGNNPALYAESGLPLVTRYSVAFHVTEFNDRVGELSALKAARPTYVVMMQDAPSFPELQTWIWEDYTPILPLQYMTVWRRDPS